MEIMFKNKRVSEVIKATEANDSENSFANLDFIAKEGDGIYREKQPFFAAESNDIMQVPADIFNTGIIYFEDGGYSRAKMKSTMELLGILNVTHVRNQTNHYDVIMKSADKIDQGYINQARFVTGFGKEFHFKDENPAKEQKIGIIDAVCGFIENETEKYGGWENPKLYDAVSQTGDGSLGLGFGFVVENSYHGIYRVWSRVAYYSK